VRRRWWVTLGLAILVVTSAQVMALHRPPTPSSRNEESVPHYVGEDLTLKWLDAVLPPTEAPSRTCIVVTTTSSAPTFSCTGNTWTVPFGVIEVCDDNVPRAPRTKAVPPRLLTHGQDQGPHLRLSSPGTGPIYFVPGPSQPPDLD
jgi:hypothetical protein